MDNDAQAHVGKALEAAHDVEAVRATASGIGQAANCLVTVGADGALHVECRDALLRFGLVPNFPGVTGAPEAAAPAPPPVV